MIYYELKTIKYNNKDALNQIVKFCIVKPYYISLFENKYYLLKNNIYIKLFFIWLL